MDVRHLRQVQAIHRQGSFVKAAEDLGVAQPTLSKSISRLEDELGVKVFDRTGTGARVTPAGALLVERGEAIIADAERLARDIELVASGQIGEARIGVGPALRPRFLPQFAEALVTRHPSLRLKVNVELRDRLLAALRAGALDVVIVAYTPELDQEFVQTEVLSEPVLAVASPSHPLAGRRRVTVTEFLRYPNAGAAEPSMLTLVGAEGAPRGTRQDSMVVCNDDTTLKLLTKRGLVTLLANQHILQPELDSGELVRLPLDWRANLTFVAAMTRPTSLSPIFRSIVDLAQQIGSELRGA
jgi:DNA-binding transcriptional LysR family regulator